MFIILCANKVGLQNHINLNLILDKQYKCLSFFFKLNESKIAIPDIITQLDQKSSGWVGGVGVKGIELNHMESGGVNSDVVAMQMDKTYANKFIKLQSKPSIEY